MGQAAMNSPWTIVFLSAACGLLAANVYYAQPIAGPISADLGIPPSVTGLIVTVTQIGYVVGLFFIVPLGDLIENRRLLAILAGVAGLALFSAALSSHPLQFFVSEFCVGIGSVAVQIILPYATHMVSEDSRGQFIGNIMGGLMIGIMLARPASSLIAEFLSWHAVLLFSAAITFVVSLGIILVLPRRIPTAQTRYTALLASMGHLVLTMPVLQRRTIYQVFLFAAFSLFWTTAPLLLAGPVFRLSQGGIALFALAGVAGAVAAPFAGRVADRELSRPATALSMVLVAAAFLITHLAHEGSSLALALLFVAALLVDFGMTANLTLGQRAIFGLSAEHRSRLNAVYLASYFLAGAVGSAVGGWSYAVDGWALTSWIGCSLPLAALLYFLTELRPAAEEPLDMAGSGSSGPLASIETLDARAAKAVVQEMHLGCSESSLSSSGRFAGRHKATGTSQKMRCVVSKGFRTNNVKARQ
jgi:predicted MFS family arabinose efflux permease